MDEMILREGAIEVHKGEKVLIPINMRGGSVLAIVKEGRERCKWISLKQADLSV